MKQKIIIIASIISITIILSYFLYFQSPLYSSSLTFKIIYKDGTSNVFDSNTLIPATIYKSSQSGQQISSITSTIYLTTTLSSSMPPYSTLKLSSGYTPHIYMNGQYLTSLDSKWSSSPIGKDLIPDQTNIISQATLTESDLYNIIPPGQTVTLSWISNPASVTYMSPSGDYQTIQSTQGNFASLTLYRTDVIRLIDVSIRGTIS